MGLSQGRWRKSYALVPGACKLRNLEGPASPSPVGPDVGETWSGLSLRPRIAVAGTGGKANLPSPGRIRGFRSESNGCTRTVWRPRDLDRGAVSFG